jgi:hypothetical protein
MTNNLPTVIPSMQQIRQVQTLNPTSFPVAVS